MDGDDDMIVIIIGDDENEKNQDNATPEIIPIKEEPVDELDLLDTKSILETAELYGEYVNVVNQIKEEYYDCEYLDDDFAREKQELLKYKNKAKIKRKKSDSDDENPKPCKKPCQSYIDQLRKNFPKMRKDEEYLVAHLTEVMKLAKPPIPPIDFCKNVDGKLVCAYCDNVSLTLPIASRHYQKKHGTRYLVCYACGLNYRCTTGLYKHEKRCPASSARLVLRARGRYLGRKGRRRPYLTLNKFQVVNKNNKDKGNKKRYYCSQCTATFTLKDALKSHEYMHQGIRPYKCDKCPIAYTSPLALRRHLVNHTDIQYICDICERSFKAKSTLIIHMNTHLPQRKFACSRCDRRFAQKSALQHHVNRDHLKVPPPLACAACPKRFPRISNLKAHMRAKHGLTLMTRKMFFKALPSMKESQLKQATVVFNELGNDIMTEPLEGCIFDKKGKHNQTDDGEDPDLQEEVKADPVARRRSDTKVVSEKVSIVNENESNSIVDTETHTLNHDEETPGTRTEHEANVTLKNAIVRTSLQERCELEFVRFISKRDSYEVKEKRSISPIGRGKNMPLISDDNKVVNESGYKLNTDCIAVEPAKTRSYNIRNISAKDNNVSKLNIDRKEPATNIVKNETANVKMGRKNATGTDKTIVTYSESDLKVDCKKVLKGPPKTRIVHKKVSMQTRSGVMMKTRAIMKRERIKKTLKNY